MTTTAAGEDQIKRMSIVYDSRDIPEGANVTVLEGERVKYRGYSCSPYFDSRRQMWSYVDVFEVEARKIAFYASTKKYFRLHPEEKVIIRSGQNGIITQVVQPEYYLDIAPDNTSYIILIERLKASRIERVTVDMLDVFLDSASIEPNTIVAKDPIPNIAPVRELFEQLGLNSVVHPVAEDYPVHERLRNGDDPHRYNLSMSPVGSCSKIDCPICFKPMQMFDPPRPRVVILGLPLDHYLTIEANKRYQSRRKKRLNHLKLMRLQMSAINLFDSMFEALDAGYEGDEDIRAATLKKLENEVEEEEGEEERGKM